MQIRLKFLLALIVISDVTLLPILFFIIKFYSIYYEFYFLKSLVNTVDYFLYIFNLNKELMKICINDFFV